MPTTSIEWTDRTWNPVRGCSRVSEGCRECYAERTAARNLPGMKSPTTGEAFAIMTDSGPRWTGKVELIESKLFEPLHWKKPSRVFVNSMSDLFHESLPDHVIGRIFAVMQQTPHITYQILTKRARRMREWHETNPPHTNSRVEFLPNVWLGVSVENQSTADERIPELLKTPAALRFVSYEPALEEVDFATFLPTQVVFSGLDEDESGYTCGLDWIIIGGESGPRARPFRLKWLRSTICQCKAAGVPLFVKQLGSRPIGESAADLLWITAMQNSKGGNPAEWPEEFHIRQFPA